MPALHGSELPELLLRLVVSALAAAVFGWERERKLEAAGLRTHILVCMGATLFTILSESYAKSGGPWPNADPGRLTAQIVSGVGFLGAGTIMVRGTGVRGLTTAATLWIAAAIGVAVGRGGVFIGLALGASLIVLFVLVVVDRWEDVLFKRRGRLLITVGLADSQRTDREVLALFRQSGATVRRIDRLSGPGEPPRTPYELVLSTDTSREVIVDRVLGLAGVRGVECAD